MKKTSKFSVQLAELRQDGLTLVKLSDVNNFVVGSGCQSWADYDYTTGRYKVIRVTYPAEYCAVPVYLTTVQLNREFNRNAVETADELREMLRNMLEI